ELALDDLADRPPVGLAEFRRLRPAGSGRGKPDRQGRQHADHEPSPLSRARAPYVSDPAAAAGSRRRQGRSPMRYFFYGSLADPDVLAAVLGRARVRAVPATLDGWRRWRVAGETYPLIAPAPGERVDGVAVEVTHAEARRLAWYEGEDDDEARRT